MERGPRMLQMVTSSVSVNLRRGQAKNLREAGFDVLLVSSRGEELEAVAREEGVRGLGVKMEREISPLEDLRSLWRLYRVIRQFRPDLTDVGTPKAGLLGGLAAWLNRVPCRIYMLHGLRCETAVGLKRGLLLVTERVACLCAHRVICVSESLRQRAVSMGIVELDRTEVLGSGSCNGVEAERFAATEDSLRAALELREQVGIARNAPVIGFVGRFVADKGIAELFEAYSRLRQSFPELRLLLVGDFEEGDPVPEELRRRIINDPHVTITGFLKEVAPYYHVMDVFALPTRREGFPTSVLEAHAAGKPVVTFRATGAVDAVVDGVDGIVVEARDVGGLAEALARLIGDPSLAQTMGRRGRDRAVGEFQPGRIWSALAESYVRSLKEKGVCCDAVRLDTRKPTFVEELQEASS